MIKMFGYQNIFSMKQFGKVLLCRQLCWFDASQSSGWTGQTIDNNSPCQVKKGEASAALILSCRRSGIQKRHGSTPAWRRMKLAFFWQFVFRSLKTLTWNIYEKETQCILTRSAARSQYNISGAVGSGRKKKENGEWVMWVLLMKLTS